MPWKGTKLNDEAKRKVSIAQKGRKHLPQEGFKKGHKPFGEKGRFKKCLVPWNKGKIGVYKKEVLKNWSKKRKGMFSGEKSPLWKGGLKEYSIDWIDELREEIRKRDDYMCQECGIHQEELEGFNKKLDVHHIDYNKFNCNQDNLITLCRNCHAKTNHNREYWLNYFK